MSSLNSFFQLEPEHIMRAAESAGFSPTGEFLQLNSYENRVFDVRLEGKENNKIILKFYRPGRWSKESILEEHEFLLDLQKEGLSVAAPLRLSTQSTLLEYNGLWVGFFPKVFGRMPDEFLKGDLREVGRLLARIHNVGVQKKFKYRSVLTQTPTSPDECLQQLHNWISPELSLRYQSAAQTLIDSLTIKMKNQEFIRIHGDCHRGNLLRDKDQFFFVDFDDSMTGPVVQDIWMLLSSEQGEGEELDEFISGYEELRQFPHQQIELMPLLRGWRILSYAAWIAKRWNDPSFPKLFPEFGSFRYWAEETEALERIAWNL